MNPMSEGGKFIWPVRVYYEDTDSGGVVYYANYLKFMERARTEWLRALGFEQDALISEDGVMFAVRRCSVDYLRPARFNEQLQVSAVMTERKRTSIVFEQEVSRGEEVLCRGLIRIVCLDAQRFRPVAIPERMQQRINSAGSAD